MAYEVDLRSDTLTKPTPAMREAMRQAEVGNAAWNEDPTLRRLEETSAAAVGKEAGLFVPSGTMGNQVAIRMHTSRVHGAEILCEAEAHIYINEAAAIAAISHAQVRPVEGPRGVLDPAAVEAAIQPVSFLKPRTALLCVENTHNVKGGAVVPPENVRALREVCERHGIPLHLDGARIFNAEAALGVPAARLCRDVDTVQFCFSKGLGAPIGSVLCGPADFIAEARRVRQYLGGALRQAGVIAAPALIALEERAKVLPHDHRRLRTLAEGLARAGYAVDPKEFPTNILVLDVAAHGGSAAFQKAMGEAGIGVSIVDPRRVRFVTHRDVDDAGIERAIAAAAAITARP